MSKEAMTLALEALNELNNENSYWWQEVDEQTIRKIEPAIKALEEALAKQEQRSFSEQLGEFALTDFEWLARRTEAAYNAGYKEGVKDAHAKQEQGEPVAKVDESGWFDWLIDYDLKNCFLYTTPQPAQKPWVGLTDEELKPIADAYRILFGGWVEEFARAIEAKLKEKNT